MFGKRRWIAVVLVGLLACEAAEGAEPNARLSRAKLLAKENAKALVTGDFAKVAELTYPLIVEKLGGREAMIRNLAFGWQQMAGQGVSFHAVQVKTPTELAETPEGLVTIVPTVIDLNVPGGRLKKQSYLIGVSTDDGRTWSFIDGAKLTRETVIRVLPGFPETMELPSPQKSVFRKIEGAPAGPEAPAGR